MIELAGSAAHVVVDGLDVPALTRDDEHHLSRVLRLRPAERVTATDGRGSWRWCRWTGGGIEPDGPVQTVPKPEPALTVAFAIFKGDRLDWIVQKLTEVGIDRLVPLAADRCIVRWDATKADTQVERLRRIVREASMQSRRVWLPEVTPLTKAATLLAEPGVSRADLDGMSLNDLGERAPGVVAIGPEGGWSDAERSLGGPSVRLGDTVLRAETAAVAAGVLLVDHRSRQRGVSLP